MDTDAMLASLRKRMQREAEFLRQRGWEISQKNHSLYSSMVLIRYIFHPSPLTALIIPFHKIHGKNYNESNGNILTCIDRSSPSFCFWATYLEIISSSSLYFNVAGHVIPGLSFNTSLWTSSTSPR